MSMLISSKYKTRLSPATLALNLWVIMFISLSAPSPALAAWDCNPANGADSFTLNRYDSSSSWKQLTAESNNLTGVKITVSNSDADTTQRHQLHLASDWSQSAVYDVLDIPAGEGTFAIKPNSGKLIAYITDPIGSEGLQAALELCTGSADPVDIDPVDVDPVDVDPDPVDPNLVDADPDPIEDDNTNDNSGYSGLPVTDDSGNLVTAHSSGLSLSTAFDINAGHYWANHEGVVGTLSDECIDLHDSYWTRGPDDKAYPTWHPAVKALADGTQCYFGHEHGDNPAPSPFYTDDTYAQLKADGFIPMPFGYANEVYAAANGQRHEDHFGHKIYRENFETAYGNSTSPAAVFGTGVTCDALLKLHQGTHSDDALSNHLHEAIAHVACTALPGYVPSRVHVTSLVPLGRPGWFSNNCGPLPVPGQTSGTRGSAENNAPIANASNDGPIVLGNPTRIADSSTSVSTFDLLNWVDGERIIPGAACAWTYQQAGSSKLNQLKFGHAMNDTWVRPLTITDSNGNNPLMYMKSYYSVFNPSRVFDVEGNRVVTKSSVDACRNPLQGGPGNPSANCQKVLDNLSIDKYSIDSPFNGTVRNLNFKSLQVGNNSGSSTIWTDAFGRQVNSSEPLYAIKQYVSEGYNGVAGAGADGTIATADSVQVCRNGDGPYPSYAASDPCYWDGNDDLLFSKEWWRDLSDGAQRIHSPN